jgi:trk system potassium uptake protein
VGSFLAERLAGLGHAVAVIEKDGGVCRKLASSIDVIAVHGDTCDYRYQEEAQVNRAHVFAAVTGDDDDNMVACQMAGSSFGVPRLVARVNNPKNEDIFNLMGIDAVSSTTIIVRESESTAGDIITLHALGRGKLAMVELDIPEEGSAACERKIKDLGLPPGCVLVSIVRGEEVIIPHGGDTIRPGDAVIAVTDIEREGDLNRVLMGARVPEEEGIRDE